MFIHNLKILNFRNLVNQEYTFDKHINIFYGENGVGKTSVLESIKYLSSGKSFRKCSYKSLINNNANDFTVFITLKNHPIHSNIALNKHNNGQWNAKIDNQKIFKQSQISTLLPVISIDPQIFDLIDLGPSYRRSYIDWLVFHVKHDYLELWKIVYKSIKHLNVLYKSGRNLNEMDHWEQVFLENTIKLNKIRSHYFDLTTPIIIKNFEFMQSETSDIDINFYPGWSESLGLKQQLKLDRDKNIQYGQLQHGPHKMDMKITQGKNKAAQILSRGQKKILSMTFYMSYIELLKTNNQRNPIICLDDFDAELDDIKLNKAAQFFKSTGSQVFITTVNKDKISNVFPDAQMFHVKHQ